MNAFLAVGIGGAFGAILRYLISLGIEKGFGDLRFPFATLAANLLGCFLIGLLLALSARHQPLSAPLRLFLITGLLGGFTTFSAFGGESVLLMRRGEMALASINVLGSVACCLLAVWVGMQVVGE